MGDDVRPEHPLLLLKDERVTLGEDFVLYRPVNRHAPLVAHLPRAVSSEPVLMAAGAGRTVPAGHYSVGFTLFGAASIVVQSDHFGVKPGEFNLVCPFLDGATGFDRVRQCWGVTPPPPALRWVKEPWAVGKCAGRLPATALDPPTWLRDNGGVWYKDAAPPKPISPRGRWRTAKSMPRWAARYGVQLLTVRVEAHEDLWRWALVCRGVWLS